MHQPTTSDFDRATPVNKHKDAVIIGDLDAPEVDALLNLPVIVGTTDSAPRLPADRWERHEMTWAAAIDGLLTQHPERDDKGGNAFFFAESDQTRTRRNGVNYCYKLKDRIRRVFAVAIDVDGGCTVEAVIERICAKGLFAVIYTTHSHTTKGGDGSARFRIVLPLAEPFDMDVGGDECPASAGEGVGMPPRQRGEPPANPQPRGGYFLFDFMWIQGTPPTPTISPGCGDRLGDTHTHRHLAGCVCPFSISFDFSKRVGIGGLTYQVIEKQEI